MSQHPTNLTPPTRPDPLAIDGQRLGSPDIETLPDPLAEASVGQAVNFAHGDVEILTQKLEGRQRRITAAIHIPFGLDQVWQVLTDYDHLADFIPNLTRSQRLPHPTGGIRLEQIGAQCFLNIRFCARVVLDMVERFPQELGFSMVEGDFRQFEGAWRLEPVSLEEGQGTRLVYDLLVLPPRAMPAGLIERHIRHNLYENLAAIRARTLQKFAAV
ncbi:MAG TPA: SRPBCC family protein [Trichocoleus sp.]